MEIDLKSLYALISSHALNALFALVIFFVGQKLASILTIGALKALKKSGIDETLEKFLKSVIYGILLAVVILAALGQLGIQTASIIAVLGAVGLAIGLAFKDSLSNISAGIMIIIFKPLKVGEFVETSGQTGTVEEINLFHTMLKTGDNKLIIIANSNVISGNIINYSRNETRRVDLTFGIGYEDDLKLAKNVLEQIAFSDERVLKDPAPYIAVSSLAAHSVDFVFRVWVKHSDYWDVYFSMNEKVKLAFDEHKITIPYPQMSVHLDNSAYEPK